MQYFNTNGVISSSFLQYIYHEFQQHYIKYFRNNLFFLEENYNTRENKSTGIS